MSACLQKQELIYSWAYSTLDVLVPKKRGTGFLRVPLGHHRVEFYAHMEYDLRCNICGLDGYLSFECGYLTALEREAFLAVVRGRLCAYHGCTMRESYKEFWQTIMGRERSDVDSAAAAV